MLGVGLQAVAMELCALPVSKRDNRSFAWEVPWPCLGWGWVRTTELAALHVLMMMITTTDSQTPAFQVTSKYKYPSTSRCLASLHLRV